MADLGGNMTEGGNNYTTELYPAPAAGHDCTWQIVRTQLRGIRGTTWGAMMNPERTWVLMRCQACKMPQVIELPGHWTAEDLGVSNG
jgi:hypothetical protein